MGINSKGNVLDNSKMANNFAFGEENHFNILLEYLDTKINN